MQRIATKQSPAANAVERAHIRWIKERGAPKAEEPPQKEPETVD